MALIFGVVGAAAGGLSPLQDRTEPVAFIDIIVGALINGAILLLIGLVIGALIDRSKRNRLP